MKMKNRVQLIGHIGQDPEVINLEGGKKLAKLRVATNESYTKTDGTRVDDTTWHNVVAWDKTAEVVEKILKKGIQIAIDGKLVNRSYQTKDGFKRYITEVVINEFVLLDKKAQS